MTMPDTIMVLAAGFGTRMGELTRDRPKPLLPLGGGTLIDHALDLAADAGIASAVVNLHYRGDQIRTYLGARATPAIGFSEELPEILDTGGGVAFALDRLGPAPFFVVNSDNVFAGPNPFATLADSWKPSEMEALLLLVPRTDARAYSRPGDFGLEANGAPQRRGDAAEAPFVYTGAQILAPSAMADAPSGAFSMNVIWDRLLARGTLRAAVHPGAWVDVGTPAGLAEAEVALTKTGP